MSAVVTVPCADLELMFWSAPTVAENLALDDALVRKAWNTGRRVLRFWWGGPPTVVIGFSERPGEVVDEAACEKFGVDVLKRSTGGGAVLQTPGVLNYSLVTPAPDSLNVQRTFRLGTDLVRAILATFDLAGRPEGISDVAIGDRKISGNAQARPVEIAAASRHRAGRLRLRPRRSRAQTSAARARVSAKTSSSELPGDLARAWC